MLNMIDEIIKVNGYDLSGLKFNSKEYVHLITEVERRAYADRATHLGDEDFCSNSHASFKRICSKKGWGY